MRAAGQRRHFRARARRRGPARPPARARRCLARRRAAATRAVARRGPGRRCAPADTPTAPATSPTAASRRCDTGRPMLTRTVPPRWRSNSRPSSAERSQAMTRPARTNQSLFWPCTNTGSTGASACAASRAAPSRHGASTTRPSAARTCETSPAGNTTSTWPPRSHSSAARTPPALCSRPGRKLSIGHHVLAHLGDAAQQLVAEQLHVGADPAQHAWPGRGHRARRAGGWPRRAAVRRRARDRRSASAPASTATSSVPSACSGNGCHGRGRPCRRRAVAASPAR